MNIAPESTLAELIELFDDLETTVLQVVRALAQKDPLRARRMSNHLCEQLYRVSRV